MGKVRRYRQKYHLSKVKASKSTADDESTNVIDTKPSSISENVFAGLQISFDSLNKTLGPDFDARSIASTKSRKELKLEEQHLKKKVKQKLRRERFLQKLDVTQQALKAAKKRGKKKQKSASNPLSSDNTLPAWTSLFNSKFEDVDYKLKQKPRGILKMKKRLKQQTKDAKQMRMILKNKKFKSNPGETILDLLKQKVASSR